MQSASGKHYNGAFVLPAPPAPLESSEVIRSLIQIYNR